MMMLITTWLWACSSTSPTSPEGMAALADRIAADPANAESVLSEAGLDRAAFEARLFEIAADEAETDAYLAARKP